MAAGGLEQVFSGWVEPVTGWGAFGGLVIFIVVSLIRGWLVPKSTHERELKASDRRGDEWKETALESRKTTNELIRSQQVVKDFFEKVPVRAHAEGETP